MTLATTFLAAALVVSTMPPPVYDDCEVVTNCVFDASRNDSNGVEVVFGRDADGDGILSRTEETMSVGCDCEEWKVVNLTTGDTFSNAGVSGHVALDWKLRLNRNRTLRSITATTNGQPVFTQLCQSPPQFLFDPTWNAAKIVRRGQSDPNLRVECSVDNEPLSRQAPFWLFWLDFRQEKNTIASDFKT